MLYKITLHQDIIKPIKNHVFQKLILYLFKQISNQTPIFTQYLLCMHKVSHIMKGHSYVDIYTSSLCA